MNLADVRRQLDDLLTRLIRASISVRQSRPAERTIESTVELGTLPGAAIALKDLPYEELYRTLDTTECYHVKMVDGGLLLFQYTFADAGMRLLKHRLAYFPCPALPSVDEAPSLYEQDELYADITAKRLVRFPIRFDFDPTQSRDLLHPASHLTLGQFEHCRIPVAGPVGPAAFGLFLVRNFYAGAYLRHKNTFDQRTPAVAHLETISASERRITHIVNGR